MDQNGNNPQILAIYHRFLNFVQLIECPVRNALTIPGRLCNFIASSAVLAAEDLKKHLSWEGLLCHGLSIVQKLHDLIMKILEAQATKPVTLGRPTPCSSTQVPNFHFHASQSHNEDSSEEKHYFSVKATKQAKEVEDDSNLPGDKKELSQVQNIVDDDVQSSSSLSIIQEKDDKELEKDQIVTLPQKRAPKKMVSINENVEIYPIESKEKMKSFERLSSREDENEESKPLKSILKKVGSNVKDDLQCK